MPPCVQSGLTPPSCCQPCVALTPLRSPSGVGKTCLLLRYANDSFSPTFITTIGIDFKIKTVDIDGKRIKLQARGRAGRAAGRRCWRLHVRVR